MMNYGFCLPDNPCDYRIVSLRAPPGSPLHAAKSQQQQMYPELANDGDDQYYVFNIFYPLLAPGTSMEHSIFSPAFLNAVSVFAANDRELETLEVSEQDIRIANAYGNSRSFLAALSQIVAGLLAHLAKLNISTQGLQEARNIKQAHAKIYRDSQAGISETALVIAAWTLSRARQHSMGNSWEETKHLLASHMAKVPAGIFSEEILSRIRVRLLERDSLLPRNGELFAMDEIFDLVPSGMRGSVRTCFENIFTQFESPRFTLKGNPQVSCFVFPMFICFITAVHRVMESNSKNSQLPARLAKWAGFLLEKYPLPPTDVAWMLDDEDESRVSSFDDFLDNTRSSHDFSVLGSFTGNSEGDNWWLSPNWLRWAWMIVEQESLDIYDDSLKMLSAEARRTALMMSPMTYLYIPQD